MAPGDQALILPRRVYFDVPASEALLDLSAVYGLARMLVVYDRSSRLVVEGLAEALESEGVSTRLYQVRAACRAAGASEGDVNGIVELLRSWEADALVAVGEPCTICASKLALLRLHRPTLDLARITLGSRLGVEASRPLLIVVPVGGSRGREADWLAVLDRGASVDLVVNRELSPFAVVLDPALTAPSPEREAMVDVYLDSLVHSMEALVSRLATPIGEAVALRAVRELVKLAPRLAREEPGEVWRDYIVASALGAAATAFASVSLTCAIAFAVQERFGTPHGLTAAILLPHTLKLYEEESAQARSKLSELVAILERIDGQPSLGRAHLHVERILETLGAPRRLRDLGVPEAEFEGEVSRLAERALSMPIALQAPVRLSVETVARLLREAY